MPTFRDIADKSLRRLSLPESEPLTVAQAKLHCSIPAAVTDFDAQFAEWISAAREELEAETERCLVESEYELALDQFPRLNCWASTDWNKLAIELHRVPGIALTSFGYFDLNGDWTEPDEADYHLDISGEPPRLTPLPGQSWPATQIRPRAVVITWTAGYSNTADIPEMARQAMRMDIAHWWRTRESAGERQTRIHDRAWDTLANSLKWR